MFGGSTHWGNTTEVGVWGIYSLENTAVAGVGDLLLGNKLKHLLGAIYSLGNTSETGFWGIYPLGNTAEASVLGDLLLGECL